VHRNVVHLVTGEAATTHGWPTRTVVRTEKGRDTMPQIIPSLCRSEETWALFTFNMVVVVSLLERVEWGEKRDTSTEKRDTSTDKAAVRRLNGDRNSRAFEIKRNGLESPICYTLAR
jgi:hypothetical protein